MPQSARKVEEFAELPCPTPGGCPQAVPPELDPSRLMASGSLPYLEAALGHPAWFRDGTGLGPPGTPWPDLLPIGWNMAIIAGIVRNGALGDALAAMHDVPRLPHQPPQAGGLQLAPGLEELVRFLVELLPSRNPYLGTVREASRDRERILISLSPSLPPDARPLVANGALLFLWRHVRPFADGDASACVLRFGALDGRAQKMVEARIDGRLVFGSDVPAIEYPIVWRERRNPYADAALWDLFVARSRLGNPAESPLVQAVVAEIRAALDARLHPPRLERLAARVGQSARSLVRHLGGEGLSYTSLIARERHARALLLLADPALSIEEVAERLAFPDHHGFRRAFRAWQGMSPGQYRRTRL